MDNTVLYINKLFQFWIDTDWYFALLMSIAINSVVFVVTALTLDTLIAKLITKYKYGSYIDSRPLKPGQKKLEIRNGLVACVVFAGGSLLSRELFTTIWPSSFLSLLVQIIEFIFFYETYSYFIHRLLHTKLFVKVHGIHHASVRVTPWSSYSIHFIEAGFIGISVPIFMMFFPLSLGMALILHVLGMMFTILIHSNYSLKIQGGIFSILTDYSIYHSSHHKHGLVNFGFVNSFWDHIFKTRDKYKDHRINPIYSEHHK